VRSEQLRVKGLALHLKVLEVFELGGERGSEWGRGVLREVAEPLAVFLGPGRLAVAINATM
jgi:hypothetical protein